jgi:hypothetical protein
LNQHLLSYVVDLGITAQKSARQIAHSGQQLTQQGRTGLLVSCQKGLHPRVNGHDPSE